MRGRRAFLRLALWLTGAAVAGCSTGHYGGPPRRLRIAAGDPGGLYVEFADLLAEQLNDAEPNLDPEVLNTGGSVENLTRVHAGSAELGLTLADSAMLAVRGESPFSTEVPLRALGRVYENYMQLVVPLHSPITAVGDLSGATISLGDNGSGAAVFGARLLAETGVLARVVHHSLSDAAEAVRDGRIDALLWSGGVPTPELTELAMARPIRLVPMLAQLGSLRDSFGPVYKQVSVPGGIYRRSEPVETIGVSNLLVSGSDLPDDIAAAVAQVLVRRAPRLVPRQALGTQYLDRTSLISTGEVAMHPGAARAYRELRG